MTIQQFLQLLLLLLTGLLFSFAFAVGYHRIRRLANAPGSPLAHEISMGPAARWCVALATILAAALLTWRGLSQHSFTLAINNPFDAFLLMGLLLSLLVIYLRWTRHLRSLAFFFLPMISMLLLIGAALFAFHPIPRDFSTFWILLHVITIAAGAICFALGCVAGAVYLLGDRQLRLKGAARLILGLPPLAALEKFNLWVIYIGFALLTIAIAAGILILQQGAPSGPGLPIKETLAGISWIVYAILAHVPFNPRFRGRRAAWLSIFGFTLFLTTYVVSSAIQ